MPWRLRARTKRAELDAEWLPLMPGVVVLPTGAWYDPGVPGTLELHGNPNVLTLDEGSSRLAQAPVAHGFLVEVERFAGEAPPAAALDTPRFAAA